MSSCKQRLSQEKLCFDSIDYCNQTQSSVWILSICNVHNQESTPSETSESCQNTQYKLVFWAEDQFVGPFSADSRLLHDSNLFKQYDNFFF